MFKRILVVFNLSLSLVFMLVLAGCNLASKNSNNPAAKTERIITASGVRLRSSPSVNADEISKLTLGTIVSEQEHSHTKEKNDTGEDYWYKVSTTEGKTGWVFGSFTLPYTEAKQVEVYQQIAAQRLKAENLAFADLTDLARFLLAAGKKVAKPEDAAELEFLHLLTLKRTVAEIPFGDKQTKEHQDWIKSEEKNIVYSEPAGEWMVESELFWQLQKKYSSLPIGERIAWEGAKNPLPGECEGYLECSLSVTLLMEGQYLSLYPNGIHAEEALNLVNEFIASAAGEEGQQSLTFPTTDEERQPVLAQLAKLRTIISKVSSSKKTPVLTNIDKLISMIKS